MPLIENFPVFHGSQKLLYASLNLAATKLLERLGGVFVPAPGVAPTRYAGSLDRANFAAQIQIRPEQTLEASALVAVAPPGWDEQGPEPFPGTPGNFYYPVVPIGLSGRVVAVEHAFTQPPEGHVGYLRVNDAVYQFHRSDPGLILTAASGTWPTSVTIRSGDLVTVDGLYRIWVAAPHKR